MKPEQEWKLYFEKDKAIQEFFIKLHEQSEKQVDFILKVTEGCSNPPRQSRGRF